MKKLIESKAKNHIPSEKAMVMLPYVQAAGEFKCDEDYAVKRKKYDSILLAVTISGKGYLMYRNRTYEIGENVGFIIDCNEPQVYFTDKKELWNFAWIHFKGANSMQQVRFILDNNGAKFKIEQDRIILKNISRVIGLIHQNGIRCDILVSKYLNEIMTDLMLYSLPGGAENKEFPEIIKKAVLIMESEYSEEIQMEALAKRLFTNKYELIRIFKKYLGITPYEYIIKYRINQSKILLESTQLPVSQIAGNSGFEDASYFIKMFRKHENITPLKYRQFWNK